MKNLLKSLINKVLSYLNLKIIRNSNLDNSGLPVEAKNEIKKIIKVSSQYSMTGEKRMYALYQAILNAKIKNLEGDFVECGVWKGGNILLYSLLNNFFKLDKKIYAFDTFDGMTATEEIDINYQGYSASNAMEKSKKKVALPSKKERDESTSPSPTPPLVRFFSSPPCVFFFFVVVVVETHWSCCCWWWWCWW